ncbi:hypothetical protein C265_23605 [Cupriavidus sp. GA3-3]|nr:hypothetical protein C265_23605 [Cupriavidus sp. GA3-3]
MRHMLTGGFSTGDLRSRWLAAGRVRPGIGHQRDEDSHDGGADRHEHALAALPDLVEQPAHHEQAGKGHHIGHRRGDAGVQDVARHCQEIMP